MNIGIIGIGEIGKSIAQIVEAKHEVFLKDRTNDAILGKKIDVLHICIPYAETFINFVVEQIAITNPKLVIIHSTVKPGTTKEISLKVDIPIVHVPIRGRHPNLTDDIKDKFVLFIGANRRDDGQKTKKYLKGIGIKKICVLDSPYETEFGKLLDTFYYGWNILFCKWVKKLSIQNNFNFEQVYTEFNNSYNDGYAQSLPQVRRPVLKPSRGGIGRHCIVPNAEIINDLLADDAYINFFLKQNKIFTDDMKKDTI